MYFTYSRCSFPKELPWGIFLPLNFMKVNVFGNVHVMCRL